jgi:hypothetical protein
MSNNIKISYNVNNIKNNIMREIKNIIFKWKGIIYGGYVRDYIISEHYKTLFWKKHETHSYNYKDFWNEKIDKDTLLRTLTPNDIDVCMYSEYDLNNMMDEIKTLINNKFGLSNVNFDNHLIAKDNNDYIDRPCGSFHNYSFKILFGAIPYIFEGIEIDISIDIVLSECKYLMPPFNKLDFVCNGFIMSNNNVINLSNNTGTEIDRLSFVEKKKVEFMIIKDLINLRTDYCMKFSKNVNPYIIVKYNEQACKRIEKLISKKNMWSIRNLPIIIEQRMFDKIQETSFTESKEYCCICCDTIKNKDKTVTLPVFDSKNKIMKGSYFHTDCFFKYLKSQIQNKISEISLGEENLDNMFLRCPLRNNIDFDSKNFSEIVEIYLQDC